MKSIRIFTQTPTSIFLFNPHQSNLKLQGHPFLRHFVMDIFKFLRDLTKLYQFAATNYIVLVWKSPILEIICDKNIVLRMTDILNMISSLKYELSKAWYRYFRQIVNIDTFILLKIQILDIHRLFKHKLLIYTGNILYNKLPNHLKRSRKLLASTNLKTT